MNKELREDLEHLIICNDKSITQDLRDDVKMTLDYIDELEKENERLSVELNTCMIERNNYLSKIDKAIECIENRNTTKSKKERFMNGTTTLGKVLDILRGEDNE